MSPTTAIESGAPGRRRFRLILFYAAAAISALAILAAGISLYEWKKADDAKRTERRAQLDRQGVAICTSQRQLIRKIRDFVLGQLDVQRAGIDRLQYYREHPAEKRAALAGLRAYERQVRQTFDPDTACKPESSPGPGRARPDTPIGVRPGRVAP